MKHLKATSRRARAIAKGMGDAAIIASSCHVIGPATFALLAGIIIPQFAPGAANHTSSGGSNIFDDDWKAPPDAPVRRPAPSEPAAPAAPRLPPRDQAPPEQPPAQSAPEPVPQPPDPALHLPTDPALPAQPAGPPLRNRNPIPVASALAGAEKLVKETFSTEYAEHGAAGEITLARALLGEARQSNQDPAALYVLLREARDAAARGGDPASAVEAARGLRDSFKIAPAAARQMERDALLSAMHAAVAAPPTRPPAPELRAATHLGMAMCEREISAGDYALATKDAPDAEQAARRTYDLNFMNRVHARVAAIGAIAGEFDRHKAAFDTLKTMPDDPAANLEAGRFFAFVLNQPDRGLPMLAKGSDAASKSAAARDLAEPATANEQMAVANAWAALAKTGPPGPVREGTQQRALFWYDAATSQLQGLERLAANKRVAELRMVGLKHGLLGEYYRGQEFDLKVLTRVDPKVEFNWNGQPPADGVPGENFSARWTGWIRGGIAGQYQLVAVHDDAVRVWIDGRLVIDKWQSGAARDDQTVRLTGNYQEIKIEFAQYAGASAMGLGWIPPRGKRAVAISADSLYHASAPAGPIAPPSPHSDVNGKIALMAVYAQAHNGARFIQDTRGDHIEQWDNPTKWIDWEFDAPGGDYAVDLNYACDANHANAGYVLSVGANRLPGSSADTGGWASYRTQRLGQIRLVAGPQTLRMSAPGTHADTVMDLGQVTLTPLKKN